MSEEHREALWREFPKTLPEFEARFDSEEACRDYLAACRWNGRPCCDACGSEKVWAVRGGRLYECGECRHQTSLTAGTLFHGTRKPLKLSKPRSRRGTLITPSHGSNSNACTGREVQSFRGLRLA